MKHVALKSLAFAACALGFSALPASAGVIVYTFDQDGCSGSGCGLTNYGTVTLTDISGGVNVKVSLLNGSGLIDTGAMSGHSLTFNLAGAPSVTDAKAYTVGYDGATKTNKHDTRDPPHG